MHIPYESLVLITASGGAIIIFFIAVAIFCICRHTRRSRKAVIHILTDASHGAEDVDQPIDQTAWERNQLIPTARFLHSLNPKAKICAITSGKSTLCPLVHSCILEHPSPINSSPVAPLINQNLPVNPVVKRNCEGERISQLTNSIRSNESSNSRDSHKPFTGSSVSCSHQKVDAHSHQSTVATVQYATRQIRKNPSTDQILEGVTGVLDKPIPAHKNRIEITERSHSFQEASTSKGIGKSRSVHQFQTKNVGKSSTQPISSEIKCSTRRENLQRRHSFRSSSTVKESTNSENRRVLRAHSFSARSKSNLESRSGRNLQRSLHNHKSKERHTAPSNSNVRQDLSLRLQSRTPSVLGITKPNQSRLQGFPVPSNNPQPSTSAETTPASSHPEDVIVLDGSEPPPPYYS